MLIFDWTKPSGEPKRKCAHQKNNECLQLTLVKSSGILVAFSISIRARAGQKSKGSWARIDGAERSATCHPNWHSVIRGTVAAFTRTHSFNSWRTVCLFAGVSLCSRHPLLGTATFLCRSAFGLKEANYWQILAAHQFKCKLPPLGTL